MISCKECGHKCTLSDFENFSGLCDHLFLDALAAFKKSKSQKAISEVDDSTKRECLRCQGLMRAESFVDWTTSNSFRGWRCLICGNVWDQEIADNRIHGETDVENIKPGRPRFAVAMTLHSRNVGQQCRIGR